MPFDLFSESVNKTNVASRKKMTSIRGMISMRAVFLPPLLPPDEPAMMELGWKGNEPGVTFLGKISGRRERSSRTS